MATLRVPAQLRESPQLALSLSIPLVTCAASPRGVILLAEEVGAAVAQKCADDVGQSSEVRVAL